ncbi:uncharacterized protein LOC123565867 [Mercenaria mercenaria]|uniref:uncharacterized protein LOC123565867 n=1 Tax=Mercenaria mercenaria TaxID=6596 RepID=UPI00234EC3A3|nr:uncharacterized protein LOC123565867 [Mercenaria mercenaria]
MNPCEMSELPNVTANNFSGKCNDSYGGNFTHVLDDWKQEQFGGYPVVYPITIYHLYPVIVFGRILHILWYVIGFVGNFISLKIWSLTRMKRLNSSALYLVGITIYDIWYQILHIFFYLKYFWGLPSLGVAGLCQIWMVLNVVPQYANQLLVLGFTIERFISIIVPFKGERFSKRQRAPAVITSITVFVFFLAAPQAYFWRVDSSGFCEMKSGEKILSFYTIWSFATESIIFFVIPVVTLLLNVFVIKEAYNSLNRRENLDMKAQSSSRIHTKGKNYKPATKTLLCISFFRILTNLPVSITYTMQNLEAFSFGRLMPLEEMSSDHQWRNFILYWGARVIIEVIGASHHALSIFIFYASTKQFRNEIGYIFTEVKRFISRSSVRHGRSSATPSDLRYSTSIYMYKVTANHDMHT